MSVTLRKRLAEQVEEALSDVNRYFFWQSRGRTALADSELIMYYIENGGSENYAKRLQEKDLSLRVAESLRHA